jgi:hypothetical protein
MGLTRLAPPGGTFHPLGCLNAAGEGVVPTGVRAARPLVAGPLAPRKGVGKMLILPALLRAGRPESQRAGCPHPTGRPESQRTGRPHPRLAHHMGRQHTFITVRSAPLQEQAVRLTSISSAPESSSRRSRNPSDW